MHTVSCYFSSIKVHLQFSISSISSPTVLLHLGLGQITDSLIQSSVRNSVADSLTPVSSSVNGCFTLFWLLVHPGYYSYFSA